jgi:hypothetical protein
VFAFIVGKWQGTGTTRLPDGKVAEFAVSWIGRYILDGNAIADEVHSCGARLTSKARAFSVTA